MEENNKIIAEFMDCENPEAWELIPSPYKSDWNWLMDVVEKIENTKIKDYGILTNITNDKTYISVYHYGEGGKWNILISNYNEEYKHFDKIQRTYQAVIEFINFYNKQKEE